MIDHIEMFRFLSLHRVPDHGESRCRINVDGYTELGVSVLSFILFWEVSNAMHVGKRCVLCFFDA